MFQCAGGALSYVPADAGYVCTTCMMTDMLSPSRARCLPEDDTSVDLMLSRIEHRLLRAEKKECLHGSVNEPELEALVSIITEAGEIGKQLSGSPLYTGSACNLKFAEVALNLALQACDKLPLGFKYGDLLGITSGQLPGEHQDCSDALGATRSKFVGITVRELAYVCFAQGSWARAAAACRCALESDGPGLQTEMLHYFRRVCVTTTSKPSPIQKALENSPDFREYRAGWLEPAPHPESPSMEIVRRLSAAQRRGPETHEVFLTYLDEGLDDSMTAEFLSEWQHLVQCFCTTEVGLRCFGCGAGPDCVCKSNGAGLEPARLHFEASSAPCIGSSVQLCNLRSPEGRKLNGLRGEVVSINEGGTGRLGVKMCGRPTSKAIKMENLRLTLLSQFNSDSPGGQSPQWRPMTSMGASSSLGSSTSVLSGAGPKCYYPKTSFRCPNGAFAAVEDIDLDDVLVAYDGVPVTVVRAIRHESEDRELIKLKTTESSAIITSDHPIMVPRGQSQQSVPAGHLKIGDTILCASGEQQLVDLERWVENTPVFQLSFHPDVPIETFQTMGEPILTKGSKIAKTRRGGMRKARQADAISLPETYDPWK